MLSCKYTQIFEMICHLYFSRYILFNYKYVHIVMPNELCLNKDFFFSFLFSCIVASVAPGLVRLLPWRQCCGFSACGVASVAPMLVELLPWRQCLWGCFRGASACGVASVAPVLVGLLRWLQCLWGFIEPLWHRII